MRDYGMEVILILIAGLVIGVLALPWIMMITSKYFEWVVGVMR